MWGSGEDLPGSTVQLFRGCIFGDGIGAWFSVAAAQSWSSYVNRENTWRSLSPYLPNHF